MTTRGRITMGRLLKYEWNETRRIIPWFFLGTVLFGLLARVMTWLEIPFLTGLSQALLVLSGVTTFVVALVIVVLQFYRSMFGAEGYLTQTLPVSAGKIVLTKFFSGVIWSGLAILVMLAALLETFMLMSGMSLADIWAGCFTPSAIPLSDGSTVFVTLAQYIWPLLIMAAISGIFYVVLMYLAITLSNTPPFNRSPVLAIPYFLILYFVNQLVYAVLMFFVPLQLSVRESGWFFEFKMMASWMFSLGLEEGAFSGFGMGGMLFNVAAIVGLLMLTVYLVRRKVNVK